MAELTEVTADKNQVAAAIINFTNQLEIERVDRGRNSLGHFS